jgi:hypothetical protein
VNPGFAILAAQRLKALPWLKAFGITGFIVVFFQGYFWTLTHPHWSVYQMPEIALDRWLSYQSWAVGVYCTLWVYVILTPALLAATRELMRFGTVAAGLAGAGLLVFWRWPTRVALHGTGFLKAVDLGGNACPSLHAAFAVFSAGCIHRLLGVIAGPRWMIVLNWMWCAAILYSTLATKQHVSLDLAAGCALGALALPFVSFQR